MHEQVEVWVVKVVYFVGVGMGGCKPQLAECYGVYAAVGVTCRDNPHIIGVSQSRFEGEACHGSLLTLIGAGLAITSQVCCLDINIGNSFVVTLLLCECVGVCLVHSCEAWCGFRGSMGRRSLAFNATPLFRKTTFERCQTLCQC